MNRKVALTFIIMFALTLLGVKQLVGQELRRVENTAFQPGEKLTFRVYYQSLLTGKVTAGEAKLQVKNKLQTHNDRKTYHILATGESKGAFNFFFKVNDRFESFIDTEALIPWKFTRRTREGGFKKDDEVNFRQNHGLAISRRAIKRIPPNTQDIVSVFYYARTLDITGMEPNESFPLAFFLDDSLYVSKIVFLGREVIKTELGTISCLKFKPMVIKGDVFSEPYPMVLWISDDKNRLPILVQSAIIVGSVKMELVEFEGLRNPMHALIEEKQTKKN
ncbi:MAG: DUF3108 domain-containing protein [Lentimicrobium sp.]|jgi:hypothetical protein|nr:DUF3108 domain-containing protein [Lentimicrobium sp.]MDD2528445.1 DUF3108 domain-containing protein [Lentimicrobiaceae bacterium]MDD4598414.1 DUF3108 domain-containing protein [Lentimicrobiaceae bacterium]MDY0026853.1 DUF3108 domain-containing protein [Lentimicrobium sp.]HAH60125.1 hypothetical protein [Bacteroidales bacterium]